MASTIRHFLPANHPEFNWDDIVDCIPKDSNDYVAQIDVLSNAFKNNKIKNILDVGAGEGSFTQTVISLLAQAQILDPDMSLSIVEKEDALFQKLKQKEKLINATRIHVNEDSYAFSEDTRNLLKEIENVAQRGIFYDLIIASHVTYYFDNGGATLAYALASRLLAPGGVLWIITRDRSCPLYKTRESFLIEKQIVDINRASFSDFLIDRMSCFYEINGYDSFQMTLRPRSSTLAIPDDIKKAKDLLGYLLWIDDLSESDISALIQTLKSFDTNYFSETHFFLPALIKKTASRNELDQEYFKLLQISALGDCIDVIRRFSADVFVHRVSMVGVQPLGLPAIKNDGRNMPDFPTLQPNQFRLASVGFEYDFSDDKSENPLQDFFTKNTSFLFYPRFFHDYQHILSKSNQTCNFAIFKKLNGSAKISKQVDYSIRRVDAVTLISNSSNAMPSFRESANEWFTKIENVYCKDEGNYSVWSLCVGATVSSDVFHPFEDSQLNECCALFITFSVSEDISPYTAEILPHIRVRLTQWLGHKFYLNSQAQLLELREKTLNLTKFRKMFEQLERPLTQISEAIGTMSASTQMLRATIYDPALALFGSHRLISELFDEKRQFKASKHVDIDLSHDVKCDTEKSKQSSRVLLAIALCRILGKAEELTHQHTEIGLIDHAAYILKKCEEQKEGPFTELVNDLNWLFETSVVESSSAGNSTFGKMSKEGEEIKNDKLSSFLRECDIVKAITTLKEVLFSPFKLHASSWNLRAVELAVRSTSNKETLFLLKTIYSKQSIYWKIPESDTPCPYHALLSFVAETVGCQATKHNMVQTLNFENSERFWSIRITFANVWFVNDQSGQLIRLIREHILLGSRDWRIDATNAGNFRKPFIDLAGKLLGICSNPMDDGDWTAASPECQSSENCISIIKVMNYNSTRCFGVYAQSGSDKDYKELIVSWTPV